MSFSEGVIQNECHPRERSPRHPNPDTCYPKPDPLKPFLPNCLSVDVEDYFQVSGFEDRVSRSNWDQYESRVESSTDRLLSIFDDAEVLGTFFILGWVAERYPALTKRIAAAGHEIASHGYWHRLVYDLTPEEFEKDIIDSREAIHNACGVTVTAYRAPSFSIVPKSRWALDILVANGYTVDSSIFPIRGHERYGDPDAPKHIHTIETQHGSILEFPLTSGSVGRFSVPIGGGYFRLFPLALTQHAIRQVRDQVGPAMFYTHPWEVDPGQPRVSGLSFKNRFRHYVGLKGTEKKLNRLLQDGSFAPMIQVLDALKQKKELARPIDSASLANSNGILNQHNSERRAETESLTDG